MSNVTLSNQNAIITTEKITLLKDMICKGSSDSELELFITNCNRTGLDPFQKQCWAVKRWDSSVGREVMAFQTGVNGFRVIANRSDKYAGQLGPFWCGDDGKWVDVWLVSTPPVAAKVGVLRSDFKEPLWAVAKFSSYAGRTKTGALTKFWHTMPELMIAKVAECLALRKAFPQDLSGIYSSEEMEQAQEKPVVNIQEVTPPQALQSTVVETVKTEIVVPVEPLFTDDEIKEVNQQVKLPNKALEIFVLKGGKYDGKSLKEINQKELYRYIAECSEWSKQHNKELPPHVQENITAIKQYCGLAN